MFTRGTRHALLLLMIVALASGRLQSLEDEVTGEQSSLKIYDDDNHGRRLVIGFTVAFWAWLATLQQLWKSYFQGPPGPPGPPGAPAPAPSPKP